MVQRKFLMELLTRHGKIDWNYYSDRDKFFLLKNMSSFNRDWCCIDRTHVLLNTASIYKSQTIEINAGMDQGQPSIMMKTLEKKLWFVWRNSMILVHWLQECTPWKNLKHSNEIWLFVRRNYGTGKTLYAFKLAAQAIQNNWSFIYLKSPELLADTLRMAKTLDKMVMVSLYLLKILIKLQGR
jgi:hypothetical protein